jgi:ribosomal-protein-alanine N-acetyltransferase
MKSKKPDTRVKIRKLKPSDIEKIIEIEKVSFPVDAYSEKRLSNLCHCKSSGFAIATMHSQPVAYLLACPKRPKMNIVSMAVDPEYRKLGIGKNLINFAIEKSKRMHLKEVSLEVKAVNKKAIRFYKKMGFETTEVLRKYYKDGKSARRMVMEIEKPAE